MRTEKTEQQISSKRDATQKNGDEQTQSGFVKNNLRLDPKGWLHIRKCLSLSDVTVIKHLSLSNL